MYKGGYNYSPRTANVVRYAGLFIPIILITYGVLIQFDVIRIPHIIDNFGFFMICFWWLYISIVNFFFPIKSKLDSGLRLIAYHLLASAYLLFVSGIASPFAGCWLLLMIGSYLYFSERGLQLSTFAFILLIAIDIFLWHRLDIIIAVYDLVALVAILITSIVTMSVTRFQVGTNDALKHSKAQESLQRDRVLTIVNNMTDAVLSIDMEGIIRVYNAASLNLLDTNDSLNGHHIDEILPLTDKENSDIRLFNEIKTTKTVIKRDDTYYTFDDGEKMRLEMTYSPIRSSYSRSKKSETHDGYIIIMRDVTKAKSLEEERDEFISVISHELRTPITIAEGTISNVQVMMEHPDITHDMLKDAVNVAHDQVIFLANMVNDLSSLSRAERGVADITEDIDIKELAHKLHNKYYESAKAKDLHLDLDLSAKLGKVHVSRLYLEETLQNFITNSIKYTKKGGVKIIVKQSGGEVTFSIKDTGIGISKSDQAKIFHKFYRSEDYRTRETSGTGLGLYVAAKLAHKLGTKIDVTSRLNFGSTFSFTLPETK
ncbi:MAG: ATP-binding protein [Candidatus Saccharibacteria bacterium]